GSGSTWSNSSYMIFGDIGGNNSMVISDGGEVDAYYLVAGYSDNNRITITGTNSVTGTNSLFSMPTSSFEVGLGGKNNIATISDGARVVSYDGVLCNSYPGYIGSNNTVVVSAAVWTNLAGHMYLGYVSNSAYNSLIITNGGQVYNASAYV